MPGGMQIMYRSNDPRLHVSKTNRHSVQMGERQRHLMEAGVITGAKPLSVVNWLLVASTVSVVIAFVVGYIA